MTNRTKWFARIVAASALVLVATTAQAWAINANATVDLANSQIASITNCPDNEAVVTRNADRDVGATNAIAQKNADRNDVDLRRNLQDAGNATIQDRNCSGNCIADRNSPTINTKALTWQTRAVAVHWRPSVGIVLAGTQVLT